MTEEQLHYSRGLIKAVEVVYKTTTTTSDIRTIMNILTSLNHEISLCSQSPTEKSDN